MPILTLPTDPVGGAWGAGMFPQWFIDAAQQNGLDPMQSANAFAAFVRENPQFDYGWYWNDFKEGGQFSDPSFQFGRPGAGEPPPPGPGEEPPPPGGGEDPNWRQQASNYYAEQNRKNRAQAAAAKGGRWMSGRVKGVITKLWVPNGQTFAQVAAAQAAAPPPTKPGPGGGPTIDPGTINSDPKPDPTNTGQGPADPYARNFAGTAPASAISQSSVVSSAANSNRPPTTPAPPSTGAAYRTANPSALTNPTPPPSAPMPTTSANGNRPPTTKPPTMPPGTDPPEPSPNAAADVAKKKKPSGIGSAYL